MVRIVLLHIVLFFAGVVCAQKAFVGLTIKPKVVEKGEPISITIKTNVEGPIDMHLPDEFIQFGPMQSGMSSSIQNVNGNSRAVRFSYQQFKGYFEEKGTFLFGPVKVSTQDGEIESESCKIRIIKRQNMISEDPSQNMDQIVFGIIEQSKKEIYEGQPFIVEGKVYSQVEILQVENYTNFELNGPTEKHSLHQSNQVTSDFEVVNGRKVQTFRIGKTLLFPEKTGTFEVNPFKTTILYKGQRNILPKRIKIVSNETSVKVKPLPNGVPSHFIGGVGQFNLSASFKESSVKQGNVVELNLKIKGRGNLQNIEQPQLDLPAGLVLYGDPEVSDSLSYSINGVEGVKSYSYYIQVNKPGKIQLDSIRIAYFNPISESYETSSCHTKPLYVKSNGTPVMPKDKEVQEEKNEMTIHPYITEKIGQRKKGNGFFANWGGTFVLFSPLMLGIVLGGFVRIRKENQEKIDERKKRREHKSNALRELTALTANGQQEMDALTHILMEFLATQFAVHKSEISQHFIEHEIANNMEEDSYQRLLQVINQFDAMRYGQLEAQKDIDHLKNEVKQIIESFQV